MTKKEKGDPSPTMIPHHIAHSAAMSRLFRAGIVISAFLVLLGVAPPGGSGSADDSKGPATDPLGIHLMPVRPNVAPGATNSVHKQELLDVPLSTLSLGGGLTPTDLVNTLVGAGVSVSNVTFAGVNMSAGTFSGGTGIIGFESGIVLSSGNIASVVGPNGQDDVTTNTNEPGDPDLDGLIPGFTTFDRTVLEFDFECEGTQTIQFQYVFTSEEYNEYVNTNFNDVFGFFLNGANIALVPGGGGLAVAINNVNCNNPYAPPTGSFCNLFINNDCSDIPPGTFPCPGNKNTEMDGLTFVFTATGALLPGTNHIKLAIADAGDHVLDSNVFIKGESFVCQLPTGACCDTTQLTCQDDVLEADCQGQGFVWSVGLACADLDPPCVTNNPPVSDPGGPYTAECQGGTTMIMLDGTGSSDPDPGDILTYAWTTDCPDGAFDDPTSPTPQLGIDTSSATFPLNCNVTLTVDDGTESDSASATVTVDDTMPPVITMAPTMTLWPPNHMYHTLRLSDCVDSVVDECGGSEDVNAAGLIMSIYSDEPEEVTGNGDGHTYNDIVIVDNSTFKVRSERQGDNNGRVYGVAFVVTDGSGNTEEDTCYIEVPHDQSGDPAIDDGPGAGYSVP